MAPTVAVGAETASGAPLTWAGERGPLSLLTGSAEPTVAADV